MAITNGYTDLATLKSALSITDTADDTELEASIEAASRRIDAHCGRRFWQDASDVTRYFTASSWHTLRLGPHHDTADVAAVTSLAVDTTGNGTHNLTLTEGSDFALSPRGNPDGVYWRVEILRTSGRCFPVGLRDGIKIVGTFGIATVPDAVAEACIVQSAKLFQVKKDGGGGFSSFASEGGSLGSLFLERSAAMLLDGHVHPLKRLQVA